MVHIETESLHAQITRTNFDSTISTALLEHSSFDCRGKVKAALYYVVICVEFKHNLASVNTILLTLVRCDISFTKTGISRLRQICGWVDFEK